MRLKVMLGALIIFGTLGLVVGMLNPEIAESNDQAPAVSDSGSGACLVSEKALQDVNQRRDELAARAKELDVKEKELEAKNQALEAELAKLDEAKKQVLQAKEQVNNLSEEKIARLVETFEAMSPKSAASVIAGVDQNLAVAALSRMSTQKLSKVIAAMEPALSSRLTDALGGIQRKGGAENGFINADRKPTSQQ